MPERKELVGRLRAIMREAVPRETPQPSSALRAVETDQEAWRRFDAEQQLQVPGYLDQSPRARQIREINRIAMRYGWIEPIIHALDVAGAGALSHLGDQEVEQLAGHMRQLVECAMTGCDPHDALPAR